MTTRIFPERRRYLFYDIFLHHTYITCAQYTKQYAHARVRNNSAKIISQTSEPKVDFPVGFVKHSRFLQSFSCNLLETFLHGRPLFKLPTRPWFRKRERRKETVCASQQHRRQRSTFARLLYLSKLCTAIVPSACTKKKKKPSTFSYIPSQIQITRNVTSARKHKRFSRYTCFRHVTFRCANEIISR